MKNLKKAVGKNGTYQVEECYEMMRGDDAGSIGKLYEIVRDTSPGILDCNRVFLNFTNGHGVNLQSAHEWLKKVDAEACPCSHGCIEWVIKEKPSESRYEIEAKTWDTVAEWSETQNRITPSPHAKETSLWAKAKAKECRAKEKQS